MHFYLIQKFKTYHLFTKIYGIINSVHYTNGPVAGSILPALSFGFRKSKTTGENFIPRLSRGFVLT